jgi:hypothetical protein
MEVSTGQGFVSRHRMIGGSSTAIYRIERHAEMERHPAPDRRLRASRMLRRNFKMNVGMLIPVDLVWLG